jgi:hypothetical protein
LFEPDFCPPKTGKASTTIYFKKSTLFAVVFFGSISSPFLSALIGRLKDPMSCEDSAMISEWEGGGGYQPKKTAAKTCGLLPDFLD